MPDVMAEQETNAIPEGGSGVERGAIGLTQQEAAAIPEGDEIPEGSTISEGDAIPEGNAMAIPEGGTIPEGIILEGDAMAVDEVVPASPMRVTRSARLSLTPGRSPGMGGSRLARSPAAGTFIYIACTHICIDTDRYIYICIQLFIFIYIYRSVSRLPGVGGSRLARSPVAGVLIHIIYVYTHIYRYRYIDGYITWRRGRLSARSLSCKW